MSLTITISLFSCSNTFQKSKESHAEMNQQAISLFLSEVYKLQLEHSAGPIYLDTILTYRNEFLIDTFFGFDCKECAQNVIYDSLVYHIR